MQIYRWLTLKALPSAISCFSSAGLAKTFLQLLHNHRLTMTQSNICLVASPTLNVHEVGVGIRRFKLFSFLSLASVRGPYLAHALNIMTTTIFKIIFVNSTYACVCSFCSPVCQLAVCLVSCFIALYLPVDEQVQGFLHSLSIFFGSAVASILRHFTNFPD